MNLTNSEMITTSFLSRRSFIQLAGLTAGSLALAACAGDDLDDDVDPADSDPEVEDEDGEEVIDEEDTDDDDGEEAGDAAAPSGTITLVHPQSIQTLDPNIGVVEVVRSVTGHIYDQIIELGPDQELDPMLAESWEVVDSTTWQFHLREDVTFHDGTPFNAEVMKSTLERILDPEYGSLQTTFWVPVVDITTPDEYTCVVETETPMGTMPFTMALTTPVHPDVTHAPEEFPSEPIGTGPFKLVEFVLDDRVVLEAFEDYWGGTPRLEQLIFRTIPELSTRMSALETGEIDIALEIVPEDVDRLSEQEEIDIHTVETTRTSWLWMNGGREPFTDNRVRQAIRHAIDVDAIVDNILAGVGYRAVAPIAPTVFGYHPDLPPIEYDPDKSRELLAEAGFPDGIETTVQGIGERGGYTRQGDVAEVVIAQLAEAGIRVEAVEVDPVTGGSSLIDLEWDMHFAGSTAVTGDADNGMGRLYLSSANRTGWANEEVDEYLTIGRESTDQDERLEAYYAAQEILWDEGPSVWLYHHIDTVAVRSRVNGFIARPDRQLRVRQCWVED